MNIKQCVVGLGFVGTLANIETIISTIGGGQLENEKSFPRKCLERLIAAQEYCPLEVRREILPIFETLLRKCEILEKFDTLSEYNALKSSCPGRNLFRVFEGVKKILGKCKIKIYEYEDEIPEEVLSEMYANIKNFLIHLENLVNNADMCAEINLKYI